MTNKTYTVKLSPGHIGVFINHPPKPKPESTETTSTPHIKNPGCKKSHIFSAAARIEFKKFLASLTTEPNLFVTLSCPIARKPNEATVRKYRDNFTGKVKKEFPESWGFWRIEPHKADGRPHYHMLIYVDPAHLPDIDKWIRNKWFQTIGATEDEDYRLADIKRLGEGEDSLKRLKLYITKAEVPGDWADWGWLWRECLPMRWGMFNKANIPREEVTVTISQERYEQVQALIIANLKDELAHLERQNKDTEFMPRDKSFALSQAIYEKRDQIKKVKYSGFLQFLNDPELAEKIKAIINAEQEIEHGEET